jgi:hypothetical protein
MVGSGSGIKHPGSATLYLAGNFSYGAVGPLVQCQPLVDLGRVVGSIGRLQLTELRQSLFVLGET